jgi:tRNA(Ile)-lysidine synthase
MLDPLTIERMEATGEGPILVALSGGGDSVALLHLLAEHFGAARLHAAVVDHQLREGSGDDARKAADIATAAGVEADILRLSWPDLASRAQEMARRLRYSSLCKTARRLGARVIAAGHTRDDQAETVVLRGSRGSGMRGLAGMRPFGPAPGWPDGRGLRLARPLLGARRAALRAHLRARGSSWIEDPSNEKEMYARVRARRMLAALEREGLDPMRFAALSERLRPFVDAIDKRTAAFIAEAVEFHDDEIILDRARRRGEDAIKQRALEVLIMAASGEERGPAPMQLETVSAALDRADFTGATLAGAWLQPRGARILIRRDPGALSGRADGAAPLSALPLPAGEETVWDGRVAVTIDAPGWRVVFDGRIPQLQRGEERRPLAAASPHWLLRERVQHVLGTD